jgi:hypothetical protein
MKDINDRYERKLFTSIGPWEIYHKLALLTFYTPYWRKVARMLGNIRRMNHIDFKGTAYQNMTKYARRAYRDTKLPLLVKDTLRICIMNELMFDIEGKDETL